MRFFYAVSTLVPQKGISTKNKYARNKELTRMG